MFDELKIRLELELVKFILGVKKGPRALVCRVKWLVNLNPVGTRCGRFRHVDVTPSNRKKSYG